jgi:flagellar hook-length control protein FliK
MIPVQPPNISSPLSTPQSVSPLRLLTEGGGSQLSAATLPQKIPPLVLGEQVSARIAEQLSNNQVAVLIKSALFTLTLPPGLLLSGDTLNLKVASLRPSLTFTLTNSEQSAEAKDSSLEVELSPASRYLTSLLSAAQQDSAGEAGGEGGGQAGLSSGQSGAAQGVLGPEGRLASGAMSLAMTETPGGANTGKLLTQLNAPLGKPLVLDAQRETTAELAGSLKQGVSNSGLFYESHLRAFEQGKMTIEQLQQEPQAKIGQALAQDPRANNTALTELGSVVQRQLNTLEAQQVPLQVMAWQGQPVQVVIEQEKSDERRAQGETDAQTWSTHLSLNLPVLGGLSARVRMVGSAVQLSFTTEESAAGDLIEQNTPRLEASMASAGLTLATLSVKHEE